jgi:hypothetical protein
MLAMSTDDRALPTPHREPAADSIPEGRYVLEPRDLRTAPRALGQRLDPKWISSLTAVPLTVLLLSHWSNAPGAPPLVAFVPLGLALLPLLQKSPVERLSKERRELRVAVGSEGIAWTDGAGSSYQCAWSGSAGAFEEGDALAIECADKQVRILPARAWLATDFAAVRSVVRAKLAFKRRLGDGKSPARRAAILWLVLVTMLVGYSFVSAPAAPHPPSPASASS